MPGDLEREVGVLERDFLAAGLVAVFLVADLLLDLVVVFRVVERDRPRLGLAFTLSAAFWVGVDLRPLRVVVTAGAGAFLTLTWLSLNTTRKPIRPTWERRKTCVRRVRTGGRRHSTENSLHSLCRTTTAKGT